MDFFIFSPKHKIPSDFESDLSYMIRIFLPRISAMIDTLITTIINRPYVVGFLLGYIFIAWRLCGPRFTFGHLLTGYFIAFVSEYLSINYGFPYGWYHYIYENLKGEWLNHGVPVWDSASYVFMCFAGLMIARFCWGERPLESLKEKTLLLLLSSFFVTLLDIVTDPVAHMGERWFLGKIYYYPNPGWYFDITFANFAGWIITSLCINAAAEFFWGFAKKSTPAFASAPTRITSPVLHGLGLYYGIFFFSTSIAVYLAEWKLLFCDLIWFLVSVAVIRIFRRRRQDIC